MERRVVIKRALPGVSFLSLVVSSVIRWREFFRRTDESQRTGSIILEFSVRER